MEQRLTVAGIVAMPLDTAATDQFFILIIILILLMGLILRRDKPQGHRLVSKCGVLHGIVLLGILENTAIEVIHRVDMQTAFVLSRWLTQDRNAPPDFLFDHQDAMYAQSFFSAHIFGRTSHYIR